MSIDASGAEGSSSVGDWGFRDLVLATPVTRARWFVTAAGSTRPTQDRDPEPVGVSHAKAMGSTRTACGLPTGAWPKFFHLAFPPRTGEVCPTCIEVGLAERRRRRKSFPGRPVAR